MVSGTAAAADGLSVVIVVLSIDLSAVIVVLSGDARAPGPGSSAAHLTSRPRGESPDRTDRGRTPRHSGWPFRGRGTGPPRARVRASARRTPGESVRSRRAA